MLFLVNTSAAKLVVAAFSVFVARVVGGPSCCLLECLVTFCNFSHPQGCAVRTRQAPVLALR